MNVAELGRLVADVEQFHDGASITTDVGTLRTLARRVIAAEKLAGEVRNILDRGYVSSCIDEEKPDHDSLMAALTAYEATK